MGRTKFPRETHYGVPQLFLLIGSKFAGHFILEEHAGDNELNLAQVAFLLSYANQSAFSNAFRRTTGHTPRDFRGTEMSA
jgi:AraC-like DNA-binding protein